jgi:Domain of unknown function (DUF4279)
MAHLQRAVATLRIAGDDLVPAEISMLLGTEPTRSKEKGKEWLTPLGETKIATTGQWHLYATDTEPENLDDQVAELLGKLTSDLVVWSNLSTRFKIDLFCGWFMREGNEGVEISPVTLKALGERGILLGIDLYGPR